MRFLKKATAAFLSVAVSLNITFNTAFLTEGYWIYNNYDISDGIDQYFVFGFDAPPLSCYEQAKEIGVREFIFTEEGKAAYDEIMKHHDYVKEEISKLIDRNPEIKYEYTASYNGFSVALSLKEAEEIAGYAQQLEIKHIEYGSMISNYSDRINETNEAVSEGNSNDLTDKIFEETGITQSGLDGSGTVIAIIDNEFDYKHEFLTAPENFSGRLSKNDIKNTFPYLSASLYLSDKSYYNERIPYIFNYGEMTYNTYNGSYSHGTHVAGIAGGNSEGETSLQYNPKGVAGGAQLLLMSTAYLNTDEILAAYDDALYLGADVINASYGAVGATVKTYKAETEAINNITASGTIFCSAAGNDGKYFGANDIFTDYSSGGSPDNITNVISVGSADNVTYQYEGNLIKMSDGSEEAIVDGSEFGLIDCYGECSLEYVPIPEYGSEEDYNDVDVLGKVAVIKRGNIDLVEKLMYASNSGAIGAIIYNNDDSELFEISLDWLPVAMVSKQAGEKLVNLPDKTIELKKGMTTINFDENINISDFSGWDFTEELLLKPDISGFGGNIISSVADDMMPHKSYLFYSGTSMSSPQLTGISALLKQYIISNPDKFAVSSRSEYTELAAKLLMSTANPIYTSDDLEIASPRVQGNGLVNINDAINTPCYISSESEKDNCRPKVSLGDGYYQSYNFNFNVVNASNKDCTYSAFAEVFKDQSDENGNLAWNTLRLEEGKDYSAVFMDENGNETTSISVKAGESARISVEMTLSDALYKKIKSDGGRFIDGFIRLTSEENPNLILSFMAFCGNWAEAGIGDVMYDFVYDNSETMLYSYLCDENDNYAGFNIMDNVSYSMPAFSPADENGDNVFDNLSVSIAFKRRCYDITAAIYNSDGKKIYEEYISETGDRYTVDEYQVNNIYTINWDFKENGIIKHGEKYKLEISGVLPLSEESVVFGSQEFVIDIKKPVVKNTMKLNGLNEFDELLIAEAEDDMQLQGIATICSEDEVEYISSLYPYSNLNSNGHLITEYGEKDDIWAVYDIAGNYVSGSFNVTENLYMTECGIVKYAVTDEQDFFADKVFVENAKGEKLDFDVNGEMTPAEVYEYYGNEETEIAYFVNGFPVGYYCVSVGIRGDANSDGKCNVRDAAYIAKMMSNKFSLEYEDFMCSVAVYCSDMNDDDEVSVRDAAALAKKLAEI